MKKNVQALFAGTLFGMFSVLNAQSIQPAGEGNMAYGGLGVDGSVVVEGGYVTPRLFDLLPVDIGFAVPTGKIFDTPGSYRFTAHGHYAIPISGAWGLNLRPGTKIYTLRTPAWSGFAWHLDFQAQAGYITNTWAVTLDLGFAPKVTTYVGPSDETKQNFPGFQSGFYAKGFEGQANYGLSGYWRFTDHFAAGMRLWFTMAVEDSKNPLVRQLTDGIISLHTTYYFDALNSAPDAN